MKYTQRITSGNKEYFYHCITRVVAGEYLFGDREKTAFRSIMQKVADFCGVDILTYCIMSNHIHILCRVPPANHTQINDIELLRRYKTLFSNPSQYRPYAPHVLEQLLRSNSPRGKLARNHLLNRMHNLSMFMKILKLRMSIWFNKTHRRFGTLWAETFKSIVVEGRGNPLLRMAQYIDLNPVRASITESSEDYPYCGLADAINGCRSARKGIEWIVRLTCPTLPIENAIISYRNQLAITGRHPLTQTEIAPPNPLFKRQTRLSNSLAMGNRDFLASLIKHHASAFSQRTKLHGPPCRKWTASEEFYFGRSERNPHS